MKQTVVLTGACGFLGAPLLVRLARQFNVVAIDCREPTAALRNAAPNAAFIKLNIGDAHAVAALVKSEHCRTVDFVLHLAAFWHFDLDEHPGYALTNIAGMRNLLDAARQWRVRRFIFASSLIAVQNAVSETLTEATAPGSSIPYGRSKAENECMMGNAAEHFPVAIVRIGAGFSDWCELPLLWSIVRMWGDGGVTSRIMPGNGATALPYIHRDDVSALFERILERHEQLERAETLLACQHGSTRHIDVFSRLQELIGMPYAPLYLPRLLARAGLYVRWYGGRLIGRTPYERPWMGRHIDEVMTADTTRTRAKLQWDCDPKRTLLARLPVIYENFKSQRERWDRRNQQRLARDSQYEDE